MEQMAMNFGRLLKVVVPEASGRAPELDLPKFLDRMRAGATVVWETYGDETFQVSSRWSSDTARGWAAFAVPLTGRSLGAQLTLARRYADDGHFAVREWAWLGVRPVVCADPVLAVEELKILTSGTSARLRRFACEVLRPRGVWSAHIGAFKAEPGLALPVLEPLVVDTDRYVRDSVANWLNDASKHQPGWVAEQCERWSKTHGERVEYVVRRALRTLRQAEGVQKASGLSGASS